MIDILLHNFCKHLIKNQLLQDKKTFDFYSKSYENIILIGDFNTMIFICYTLNF